MYTMKKVMAIHDMSCYGRASLTSIIPIISTMGIQVCPLPTAVLSTHTGGYGKPEIAELSDFMQGTKNHWKSIGLEFDCIYTGYLADIKQVQFICSIIDEFKKENQLVVIDPVMADEGKLYGGFSENMIVSMRQLIKKATVITPNITEAAFLLGYDYNDRFDDNKVNLWAKELADFSKSDVVITSAISVKGDKYIDTIVYNNKTKELSRISVEKINKYYPGTGDAFSSVLVSCILKAKTIEKASEIASEFVSNAIHQSSKYDYNSKEGILLELAIPNLISIK